MIVKHLLPLESEYQQRPEYFRVTIFGESAGSASIGHLLLSDVTTGLFSQVDKSFLVFIICDFFPMRPKSSRIFVNIGFVWPGNRSIRVGSCLLGVWGTGREARSSDLQQSRLRARRERSRLPRRSCSLPSTAARRQHQPCVQRLHEGRQASSSHHCTMFPLSNKSCFKSNKLRPILKRQFCHVISKNICLNVFGSKQPREILVVILKL